MSSFPFDVSCPGSYRLLHLKIGALLVEPASMFPSLAVLAIRGHVTTEMLLTNIREE